MNIFEKVSNYLLERKLTRLEAYLKMINTRYEYNPFKTYLPASLQPDNLASERLSENFVWYCANIKGIRDYYKNHASDVGDKSYFWATVPEENRKVHSGLPLLISRKMATIIYGNGIEISVNVYKDGKEESNVIDETKSKYAKDLLLTVINDEKVNLQEKLENSEKSASWSGHIAFKLSHDVDLSPFPIVEIADKRTFEVVKNRGITTAIIFKTYHTKKVGNVKKEYILHEIYSTASSDYITNIKNSDGQEVEAKVEKGTAIIRYELYFRKADGKLEQVELTTIDETANLPNEIVYFGFKGMLALDMKNLKPDGEFVDSPYGVSDYQGAYSTYDALDEIVSEIVSEIRDNKTLRYIPNEFIESDGYGDFKKLNKYITNFVVTHDSNINNPAHDPKLDKTEFEDKTSAHYDKYKVLIGQACSLSGLSVISLGIPGLESIDSSDKSTRERTKATQETRKEKIRLRKPVVQNLLVKIMQLTSWIQSNFPESIPDGIPTIEIDYGNCDINVDFNDYVVDSITEKVNTWSTAKSTGIASTEMVVRKIHGDTMTENQIIDEVNRIRYEQGLLFNTPDLLQLNGNEDIRKKLDEDEV